MNKPELLAPASYGTLKTAVQAGADAVYLGGRAFGARSYADNFDNEKLEQAVDYCHLRGVKVYLTLNTLVTDKELNEAARLAEFAARTGVDAFIVQDLGLAERIKCLGVPLHASTQLTIHNTYGARLMKSLGFKRVVLSREMTKEEIAEVTSKAGIETEIFVHGALCMCYSGQCLMSSIIGGRSGNRGKCAQPCRLPYTMQKDGKDISKGYYLSPKDLSLAQNIYDIKETGVTSLKIEGRMKGKEYVAAAVSIFSEALRNSRNAGDDEMELLKNSFSRGGSFTKGRFAHDKNIMLTHKGNDDVYDIRNEAVLEKLKDLCDDRTNLRKFPVSVRMKAYAGMPLEAEMEYKGFKVLYCGKEVQRAEKKAADYDTVFRQINKTGDFPIYIQKFEFDTDGQAFMPLSEINEVRRNMAEGITAKITDSFKRDTFLVQENELQEKKSNIFTDVSVATEEQLKTVLTQNFRYIFAPYTLCDGKAENVIAVFPDIIKEENFEFFIDTIEKKGIRKICSGNAGLILKALEKGLEVWGTQALNIYNSRAAQVWHKLGLHGAQLSPELSLRDIKAIEGELELSVMSYGYLPLMKTANCPVSAAGKCGCDKARYSLKDRKNEVFDIVTDKQQCIAVIYNSKPVYMGDKKEDLKNTGTFLSFTSEDGNRCRRVIEMYNSGKSFDGDFTRGHFYRGAL